MKLGIILQPCYTENFVSSEFQGVNLCEWLPEKSLVVVPQKWVEYVDFTPWNESLLLKDLS